MGPPEKGRSAPSAGLDSNPQPEEKDFCFAVNLCTYVNFSLPTGSDPGLKESCHIVDKRLFACFVGTTKCSIPYSARHSRECFQLTQLLVYRGARFFFPSRLLQQFSRQEGAFSRHALELRVAATDLSGPEGSGADLSNMRPNPIITPSQNTAPGGMES